VIRVPRVASDAFAQHLLAGSPRRRAGHIALAVGVCMLAAMLGIAFERDLVGTLTQHGWGRTLQGVGAALTRVRCGVGGAVIDNRLDNFLRIGGFNGNPRFADTFDDTYGENLLNKKRLQRTLDQAKSIICAPSTSLRDASGHYVNLIGFNGEDAGMSTYTVLAFLIFGINIRGLTFTYFILVVCTLVLFAVRHGRNPAAMVAAALMTIALYFSVCSSMFNFTMPAEFGFLPGIDIKDPRFLGTIAAIPLLHIIVTWLQPDHQMTIAGYVVLALQTAIIAFATHLRFAVVWTISIPLLLWTLSTTATIWRGRGSKLRLGDWRSPRSFLVLVTTCAVVGAANLAASYSYHPFYALERDVPCHTFWDGVLQSLEYNPDWQTKYSASMNGAASDQIPLTAARLAIAKLPADQQRQYLQLDGNPTRVAYETFSKAAFLEILSRDPGFVLKTFLVIKPLLILRSEATMYRSLFAGLGGWHALVASLALVILGWLTARHVHSVRLLCELAGAACFCALAAWLPNWLVLANELVMFDNFVWGLFLICLAPFILAVHLQRLTERASQRSGGRFFPVREGELTIRAPTAGGER